MRAMKSYSCSALKWACITASKSFSDLNSELHKGSMADFMPAEVAFYI